MFDHPASGLGNLTKVKYAAKDSIVTIIRAAGIVLCSWEKGNQVIVVVTKSLPSLTILVPGGVY